MRDAFDAAWEQNAVQRSGMGKYWIIEQMTVFGKQNGVEQNFTINVMMHKDRGIAFGNSTPVFGEGTPKSGYFTDILHVPTNSRMFTVGGCLSTAASLALIVASTAPWQTITNPREYLCGDVVLSELYRVLMKRNYAFVVSGSDDEAALFKHARAFAQANTPTVGNA